MPTLDIARTWKGEPVPEAEQVHLRLESRVDHLHLLVKAPFHADPPPPGPAGPTEGLWEHEVVEIFIAGPNEIYTEVELGPHGHHLVLRLAGVRKAVARALPLSFQARIDGQRWTGEAVIPLPLLPPRPWRVNAYAIHGQGPDRRYLALSPVPGEQPDFHQLERFVEIPGL